ncbi:MAG: EF-P beta-lysylation protein EpmB [Gammaproteobacteria bacterium]|nr:EF-P beta-lysylation protein EpmB [Gammaproteobacteria bacterium]
MHPNHALPSLWQNQVADAIRNPAELLDLLALPAKLLPQAIAVSQQFPLRVPRVYVNRMKKGDQYDPLLLQVLPLAAEAQTSAGFKTDPVGDLTAQSTPGLIHKYHGRVLLVVTGACAIHCRYCFRRHFPYSQSNPLANNWQKAQQYIESNPDIKEIILSGGDPLSLSDNRLAQIIRQLEQIPQLKTLRLHTRLPVVIPERINPALLTCLQDSRFKIVMVIHVNHSNELDKMVKTALTALHAAKVTLLNQSVLLKGINDNVTTLKILSEALFNCQVLPYYLHQLDKVSGAAHFEVSDTHACQLLTNLQQQLPGYLVPKLVREQAGALSKLPLY